MLRILVVDDEKLERDAISQIINEMAPEAECVGKAANGEEALVMTEQLNPDALFIDIQMPGISGIELVRRINKKNSKTKMVIVSAYDVFDYAREAIDLGVVEYILKPARSTTVQNAIRKLSDIISAEKEIEQHTAMITEQLKESLPYIKSSLIYDILVSNNCNSLAERASFLGFNLVPSVVLSVDIDNFAEYTRSIDEGSKQLLKKEVFDVVLGTVTEKRKLLAAPLFEDKIVILISVNEEEDKSSLKQELILLADSIRCAVIEQTDQTCTVGIGDVCNDIRDISLSYDNTHDSIIASKLLLGGNRTVHVNDMVVFNESSVWYPYKEERKLKEKIAFGEYDNINSAANDFTDALTLRQEVPLSSLKNKLLEFVIVISRAADEGGANPEALAFIEASMYRQILDSKSRNECIKAIGSCTRSIGDLFCASYTSESVSLVKKAVAFLSENYDKDISLQEIANTISLSPHYFSRLFKTITGLNFVDYLTEIRISQAKQLLRQTSMMISEVAEKVGYRDASYFTRVFVKTVGTSPREYRGN